MVKASVCGGYIYECNTPLHSDVYIVQLFEYDFKMSTFYEKVKAEFTKLGEYFYARDLMVIFVALVVESLLFIGIQEYGKTLKGTTVKITCNDKSINYPMAPEEQIDWTKQLFVAGILLYFVISIGHTISVMKKLDDESQMGMLDGALRNVPMIRLVRSWGLMLIGLFFFVLVILGLRFFWPYTVLAYNFISVCKPDKLELLCGPHSYQSVDVMCTTAFDIWFPARSATMSTYFTLQVFIMLQTLWYVLNMSWTGVKRYLNTFVILVSILLTVGIACSAFHRNETSIVVFVISFFVVLSIFDDSCLGELNGWLNWDGQQKLPSNWNDVTKTGQVPLLDKNNPQQSGNIEQTTSQLVPKPLEQQLSSPTTGMNKGPQSS